MENIKSEKKSSIGSKIWKITKITLLSLLLLLVVLIVGLKYIFGFQYLIVTSGSMTPTIAVGSMVVVKPTDYEDLKVGDIVTFRSGNTFATHRVVLIDGTGVRTMGDYSNPNFGGTAKTTSGETFTMQGYDIPLYVADLDDHAVNANYLQGTTVMVLPATIGIAINYLKEHIIVAVGIVVGIVGLIMLIDYLRTRNSEDDDDEEDNDKPEEKSKEPIKNKDTEDLIVEVDSKEKEEPKQKQKNKNTSDTTVKKSVKKVQKTDKKTSTLKNDKSKNND